MKTGRNFNLSLGLTLTIFSLYLNIPPSLAVQTSSSNLPHNSNKAVHSHAQETSRWEITHEGVSLLLIELIGLIVVPVIFIPLLVFAVYWLVANAGKGGSSGGWGAAGGSTGSHYYGANLGGHRSPPPSGGWGQPTYKRLDKEAQLVDQVNNLTAQVLPKIGGGVKNVARLA